MNYDASVWLFLIGFAGTVGVAFASARGRRVTLLGALAGLWLLDVASPDFYVSTVGRLPQDRLRY